MIGRGRLRAGVAAVALCAAAPALAQSHGIPTLDGIKLPTGTVTGVGTGAGQVAPGTEVGRAQAAEAQALALAQGAVQSQGGDASGTVVKPLGSTYPSAGTASILGAQAVNASLFCAAVVNTGADAAPCLGQAAAAAAALGKHTVYVPAGLYTLASSLQMTSGVIFQGDGWDEAFAGGTRFVRSSTGFVPFTWAKSYGGFRDISFSDAEPTPSATAGTAWTPTAYGPWGLWQGGKADIRNVMLYGVTSGFWLGEASDGTTTQRSEIDGIYGQVYNYAVTLDAVADSSRINNAHFWPFVSFNSNIYDYTIANATPIVSNRDDNPHLTNIFGYAAKAVILFGAKTTGVTTGVTSKAHIANLDADSGLDGAWLITGTGTSVQAANVSVQATRSPNATVIPASVGMSIQAAGSKVDVANYRSTYTGQESIRIDGSNNQLMVSDGHYELWGQDSGSTAGYVYATPSNGNIVELFNSAYAGVSAPKSTGVTSEVAAGSGTDSLIVGSGTSQTASGAATRSLMPGCAAFGSNVFCAATSGSGAGSWSSLFGLATRSIAGSQMSVVLGYLTTDRGYLKAGLFGSAGPFAVVGDDQWSIRHVYGQTAGTTGARLTSGGTATTNNTLNLPAVNGSGLAYGFEPFTVLGHDKAHDLACSWTVSGLVLNRSAASGSTRIVGSPTIALGACDNTLTSAGFAGSSLTIAADTTNDGPNISVAGVSGYNLDLAAAPKLIEVQ